MLGLTSGPPPPRTHQAPATRLSSRSPTSAATADCDGAQRHGMWSRRGRGCASWTAWGICGDGHKQEGALYGNFALHADGSTAGTMGLEGVQLP